MLALAGAGLAATGLMVGAAVAAAPSNGSFEAGTQNGDPWDLVLAGETVITDWTVGGSVDFIASYWPASDGDLSIDLTGSSAGSLSQTFDTVIGANYTVTFDMSGNPAGDALLGVPAAKTLEVSVDALGASTESETYNTVAAGNSLTNMKWESRSYSFTATSISTTLMFESQVPGFYGPALDNVVISETLATAEDCKKDGWKGMFDTSLNAFKNQGDCVSFFATGGKNVADGGAFDFTP